jgi:hypothetical protein
MNIYLRTCLIGMVVMVLTGVSFAQKDKTDATPKAQTKTASKPKAPPAPKVNVQVKPMVVTVQEVSGTARRLVVGKDDKKWVALKVGDKLDELTIICTGFRTKVVLTFADNSELIINRVTQMGIREFRKEGKVTKTALGLKYGSLRATVKKADGPNNFRISTPTATAAARGSVLGIKHSGDFGNEMNCSSGKWNVKKGHKNQNLVKGERTDNNLTASIRIIKKKVTPIVGDVTGGLSRNEIKLAVTYGSKGRGAFYKRIGSRSIPRPLVIIRKYRIPRVHVGCLDINVGGDGEGE